MGHNIEQNEKLRGWLGNLRLFALNSEIHCSREEKAISHELLGTRRVNAAFDEMIKYMHMDLGYEYDSPIQEPAIVNGGRQLLLFSIGNADYYADLTIMHETMTYPCNNYNLTSVKNEGAVLGIINWHEGLVPLISTQALLGEEAPEAKFAVVCDIGKELFAFTLTNVHAKHEIEMVEFGKDIKVGGMTYRHLDFASHEGTLVALRKAIQL